MSLQKNPPSIYNVSMLLVPTLPVLILSTCNSNQVQPLIGDRRERIYRMDSGLLLAYSYPKFTRPFEHVENLLRFPNIYIVIKRNAFYG